MGSGITPWLTLSQPITYIWTPSYDERHSTDSALPLVYYWPSFIKYLITSFSNSSSKTPLSSFHPSFALLPFVFLLPTVRDGLPTQSSSPSSFSSSNCQKSTQTIDLRWSAHLQGMRDAVWCQGGEGQGWMSSLRCTYETDKLREELLWF